MWIKSGYHPVFIDRRLFLANPRANFKARIFNRPFSLIKNASSLSSQSAQYVVLTDQPVEGHPLQKHSLAIMKVSLDAGPLQSAVEHAWPFPMFPAIYEENLDDPLAALRESPRHWTFFFGGRSSQKSYDKGWVSTVYHKVPRNRYLALT